MSRTRKPITTPKYYVFTIYSFDSGEQGGFSCLAKNEEQAERKFRREYSKSKWGINEIIECE